MTTTVAFRVPDDLLAEVDEIVASGRFTSRTDAFRTALEALVHARLEQLLDERIVAGYVAIPHSEGDVAAAESSLREMLDDESW